MKLTKNLSRNKGFTLVEILVVVSIILISVGVAGDLIVSVTRSYNKTRILNEIEQNGNYVIAKITNDLKNATSVTISSGALQIVNASGQTISYRIQSNTCSGTNVSYVSRRVVTTSPASDVTGKMTSDGCRDGINVTSSSPFAINTILGTGVQYVSVTLSFSQVGSYAATSQYAATQSFTTYVTLRSGN